jgi:hypothetical protein
MELDHLSIYAQLGLGLGLGLGAVGWALYRAACGISERRRRRRRRATTHRERP